MIINRPSLTSFSISHTGGSMTAIYFCLLACTIKRKLPIMLTSKLVLCVAACCFFGSKFLSTEMHRM